MWQVALFEKTTHKDQGASQDHHMHHQTSSFKPFHLLSVEMLHAFETLIYYLNVASTYSLSMWYHCSDFYFLEFFLVHTSFLRF